MRGSDSEIPASEGANITHPLQGGTSPPSAKIDPWRIEMLPAIIPVARSTSSRMIGCPFCGRCAQDRQTAVLRSARARGRKGGRPFKMTAAKLRLAMAAMGQQETKIGELCKELSITRQTLYRHVSPKGELRPDGLKLLSHS